MTKIIKHSLPTAHVYCAGSGPSSLPCGATLEVTPLDVYAVGSQDPRKMISCPICGTETDLAAHERVQLWQAVGSRPSQKMRNARGSAWYNCGGYSGVARI